MVCTSVLGKCLLALLVSGGSLASMAVGYKSNKVEIFSAQGDMSQSFSQETASSVPVVDSPSSESEMLDSAKRDVDESTDDSSLEEETLPNGVRAEGGDQKIAKSSGEQDKNHLSPNISNAEGVLNQNPKNGAIQGPESEDKSLVQKTLEPKNRAQIGDVDAPSNPVPKVKVQQVKSDFLPAQEERNSKNNWFSIEEKYLDSLEQEDLYPSECDKSETEGKALIKCPWILSDPETTISFYFDLESNPKLRGKKIDNLRELSVTPKTEDTIDLGMIFNDDISDEIKINLSYSRALN